MEVKKTILDTKVMSQQNELAQYIERYCHEDGVHSTTISSLHFIRASHKSAPIHSVHQPALCIVAQGKKLVMLAQDRYQYDPAHYLVISVDLPVSGEIIQAEPENPYLCLRLDFEPKQILDIVMETDSSTNEEGDSQRGLFVSRMNSFLLDAVLRLVRLLDTPDDLPILAPLVIREILYRVLQGEQGDSVRQIAMIGSHAQRIAKVIQLIKQDFAMPLRIEELAFTANMSSSSLHHHFKQVTRLSPLQYQKQLRLQAARHLMFSKAADAADAGFQVGYESPSQFSREYARMFGLPPISDIKRLRQS
ncbi:AraC family transcriptional regulator [Peribacillus psychrosaccharolyticus]|uniref:AraC family transcriptional regulator n=1 Tax=Peribacillus psychrosaccharolyticus TaxID=1407 RepID=A0A974NM65_PERPY|nr:AraC family transcriptional regulator [Peribacillus psychrosaccharolyticus]MEC2056621.1 AraC family transcriptional regulator [Peribacillus psychrosaccharolyticus]MED3745753.1 AraC family transcriptional regulator [Peribacillus psychrosaccharolyticus]QQT00247.1 AraC family transcriptional regulator [Peribacillus psychrosaccharolyticus]